MNRLYPKAKEAFLNGKINILEDNIKVILVDSDVYTFDLSHEFLSSVSGIIAPPQTLVNRTNINGVFDADDVTFPNVSGTTTEVIIMFKDTAFNDTSHLIAYIDDATGLAVTPNGGDIKIQWSDSMFKIFSL